MIHLITSLYYYSTDDLINCLINNLNSEYICNIYIYFDTVNTLNKLLTTIDKKYFEKIHMIRIGKEPLFSELFLYANDNFKNEICMISLPGIYLEDCNINYINKIQNNIYCIDNNAFIFKSPLSLTDIFYKNCEHIQNINGSIENIINNLFENGYKLYNPNKNIKTKNIKSLDIINYSSNISYQKYLIDELIINNQNSLITCPDIDNNTETDTETDTETNTKISNENKLVKYSLSKKLSLKVVVLHLSKFPERLIKLKEVLDEFTKINIEFEIFNGVIGTSIEIMNTENRYIKLLKYNNDYRNYETRERINRKFMKPGELGCAWSHLNIYKKLVDDNEYDNYLVIEDDVVLLKSIEYIKEILENIPPDYDFCNTNISLWYPFKKTKQVNKYFYKVQINYFSGMTSYLVSKSGARKLLNFAGNNINIPSDDLVCTLFRISNNFHFYIPEEPIIYERPNTVSVINKLL